MFKKENSNDESPPGIVTTVHTLKFILKAGTRVSINHDRY